MLKEPSNIVISSNFMSADSVERFQLSRQDASVSTSRKSPLGRTDNILYEVEDDESECIHVSSSTSSFNSTKSPVIPPTNDFIGKNNNFKKLNILTVDNQNSKSCNSENNLLSCRSHSSNCLEDSSSTTLSPKNNQNNFNSEILNGSTTMLAVNHNFYPVNKKVIKNYNNNCVPKWKLCTPVRSQLNMQNALLRQQTTLDDVSGKYPINGSQECPFDHLEQYNQPLYYNGNDKLINKNKLIGPRNSNPVPETSDYHNQNSTASCKIGDVKLQSSLSTPCENINSGNDNINKSSNEYRRFKSEGSTTNPFSQTSMINMEGHYNDGISLDHHRMHMTNNGSHPNYCHHKGNTQLAEVSMPLNTHTDQVMLMHTLKTKLQKYQQFIDKAFELIQESDDSQVIEGCTIVTKVMQKAWLYPRISQDLAHALCDYLKEKDYLEIIINIFIKQIIGEPVRLACGRLFEEILSLNNREYIVQNNYLKKITQMAEKLNKNPEQQRMSLSIMECLFKHSSSTTYRLIDYGILDHILLTCKRAADSPATLRQASLALANLVLYSCPEARKKIVQKKLPDWLFLLASQPDDITRYYACLAICVLASCKEMELAVATSGTLALVEPFLLSHNPTVFASNHYKQSQGRPKEWLIRLLPLLNSKCREAKSITAFHFTMESVIKKNQDKIAILHEIGAIPLLKEVASSPDDLPAQLASEALTIIGEEVPYKLSRQVPCWSVENVQCWVAKIGFEEYCESFGKHKVDGDLLLLLNENELENDIGMKSGLLRKKFLRELESLKIAADYSSIDDSNLDTFLMSLSPELSAYTYPMLNAGITRAMLPQITEEWMVNVCGMTNEIHKYKLKQALQDGKHIDDIEVAQLSKQYDIFISYRRSNGNQLASLIKVMLTIQGYKVFIDVDRLHAGKFDSSLLKNIQAAKHFILVLTEHSLDRLINDHTCDDWIHKELKCAFEHNKNIVPVIADGFKWPSDPSDIPADIRQITTFNGVNWVHEYQDACITKIKRFLTEYDDNHKTRNTNTITTLKRNNSLASKKNSSMSTSTLPSKLLGSGRKANSGSGKNTPLNNGRLRNTNDSSIESPSYRGISIEKSSNRKFFSSTTAQVM
ncbi:Ectoderm-expressed 4 [Strongyloides ratti]|uniref:ADP-ribosyl cyclase/cyclic ADP-ribose hydrolase n=1 Tax=Strongyloides ratti TaxID=34506 RepID=A0A090L6U4_STRRB|nr:Ectoderm-expressed 4 [Strongyloides ratti]CEF63838.1 Ectoderm-expressed 4 [Strongyloides ratti]